MSTIDLEVEEIDLERFEENEDETEVAGEENAEGGKAEGDEEEESTNKKTVKPKRVVRNPRPTLNVSTLKGKRGLVALESHFERVNFKGRGHEEDDLSVILKTYEYWCHRLFPKYPFDDCISKIESLGKKRPVATFVKRLRADLPYDCGPDIINEHDPESEHIIVDEVNDNFDELLETQEVQQPEITEEQMERIRLNKERAEKIRMEKLRQKRQLSEASGSQNLHSSENSNTELLFEEGMSQMEVLESENGSSHNSQENVNSVQLQIHNNCEDVESENESSNNSQENVNIVQVQIHTNCLDPPIQDEIQSNLEDCDVLQKNVSLQEPNHTDVSSNFSKQASSRLLDLDEITIAETDEHSLN